MNNDSLWLVFDEKNKIVKYAYSKDEAKQWIKDKMC